MRYNTTATRMEYCNGSSWQQMGIASTGLYGLCYTTEYVSGSGGCSAMCGTAIAPATCNAYSVSCECPSGYSPVLLFSVGGYCAPATTYSCYKN